MDFNKSLDDLKDKGQQHFDENKDEYMDKGKELISERFNSDNAEAGKDMEAGPDRDDTSRDEQ
ncbi:hypothetical protein [Macrococcus equipercicus]|uniref:Antitoxin n=1 Tax=Macrococcus equipercicus TaxID=69967 RepID=A0A9Q9BTA9_9STAP|nr:hypothetical protein [Macrococcus equipercicus]UTH13611.1 hypothetical protein KFV11_10370 [Macrococcus equipercicus]